MCLMDIVYICCRNRIEIGGWFSDSLFPAFSQKLFFQPIIIMRKYTLLFIALLSITYLKAQEPLDEFEVYNRLIARKTQSGYQEGTPWTNDKMYVNTVEFFGYSPGYFTGRGCYGFMIDMMEYCSNYEYPITRIDATYDNLPLIQVGDGIRLNNDTHSVIVLDVAIDGHTVTVAEGNYNYSVHWGRVIDLADPSTGVTYIASFWPNVTAGVSDCEINTHVRDIAIVSPAGTLLKSVYHTEQSVRELLSELPKGYYIVKEGAKTYKVFNRGN